MFSATPIFLHVVLQIWEGTAGDPGPLFSEVLVPRPSTVFYVDSTF